jgi:pyruvate kinase
VNLTRTKIVATVGPASGSPEMIRQLIAAGVDVFRLNFSHGDHAAHEGYIRAIRAAAAEAGAPIAVMQDLQGPRIRTGALRGHEPVDLKEGSEVVLRPGAFEGDARTVSVNYERLAADVKPGDTILLSDGLLELRVTATDGAEARCRVEAGGALGEHKGINLPGVNLSITSPTEKDIDDLRFGIEHDVDFVALSFVRTADDVAHTKPEPELYLSALAAMGLGPDEAIALEDSVHGVLAAKRAGLFCVAVPNPLTRELKLDHERVWASYGKRWEAAKSPRS